jgi:ribose 5-phosphate isomerase A
MNPKQRAAEAAIRYVKDRMVVGLGTGSTSEFFIRALGKAVQIGKVDELLCVPTSLASERLAKDVGLKLAPLTPDIAIDVTVDGADEVDPNLDLIKGLGGALLREKIVAQNSRQMIVIADASKVVPALGTKGPLPIEVATFGHELHVGFLKGLGGEATLRRRSDGSPYVTDNGNYIYDTRFPRIDDPAGLEVALKRRAGVVESGLFVDIAQIAVIGTENGVEEKRRRP